MFYYNDKFYDEIEDLLIDLEWDTLEVTALSDDYTIEVEECDLQPLVTLSPEWILDRINEDRGSEEGDEFEQLRNVLTKHINFEELNKEIPELWYSTRRKFKITKAEMLEACE